MGSLPLVKRYIVAHTSLSDVCRVTYDKHYQPDASIPPPTVATSTTFCTCGLAGGLGLRFTDRAGLHCVLAVGANAPASGAVGVGQPPCREPTPDSVCHRYRALHAGMRSVAQTNEHCHNLQANVLRVSVGSLPQTSAHKTAAMSKVTCMR